MRITCVSETIIGNYMGLNFANYRLLVTPLCSIKQYFRSISCSGPRAAAAAAAAVWCYAASVAALKGEKDQVLIILRSFGCS